MPNAYERLITRVFELVYVEGASEAIFKRELLLECAAELGVAVPKNIGDVVYTFRYRRSLPAAIRTKAPKGLEWVIRPAGDGIYKFVAVGAANLHPTPNRAVVKVPDATPGIIAAHALEDEQALLAKLRYNRLVDIFLRITCYSLQNHLRTKVPGLGQLEVDELYLGIDRRGAQFVIPVQAKGGRDKHSVVQIEQDIALCQHRFPELICRSVGAQFMSDQVIAMMEFELQDGEVVILNEAHYKLVNHHEITKEEIASLTARGPE
ncbi:MAG: endonuclease [Armatimonadetes bacterium]|nr:endonuclease [Armatimonadota bacterium]